jgi:hypothetical protein
VAALIDLPDTAARLRVGRLQPAVLEAHFHLSTVYVERAPNRPGVMVVDLGERGVWAPAFSSLERLETHVGECDYLSLSGADLLAQMPPGVGVVLDPRDDHTVALSPRKSG